MLPQLAQLALKGLDEELVVEALEPVPKAAAEGDKLSVERLQGIQSCEFGHVGKKVL